ncbi:MAG: ZrgA family zinc uptake protein, partial [Burkholderiaceae bacterium]
NFLSFEHAPKTDAQRAQLKALQDQLKDAAWLVVPAAQAQCKVTSVKAESALFDLSKPVKGHADLDVDIAFECANPSALTSLRFSSLDKGRRMKKLMVAYVGPSGQKAVTLTQAKPVLELK